MSDCFSEEKASNEAIFLKPESQYHNVPIEVVLPGPDFSNEPGLATSL